MVRSVTLALAGALAVMGPTLAAQQLDDDWWLRHCRDSDNHDWQITHCEVRVSRLERSGGPITVNPGENGGVSVAGWDQSGVEIHARIETRASSEEAAAELARSIRVVTAGTTIGAEGPESRRHASWSVSFALLVPRQSDLQLDSYNGPIAVRDVRGRMELKAYNGPLALADVGGDVHARTTNGPLEIELGGTSWPGAGLDAETTNGPIELSVPTGYNAELETGTVNGPMTVGFPVTVTLRGRLGSRFKTTLGSGGAPIRVVTTNGPVTVHRE